jgi:hypothetical protein
MSSSVARKQSSSAGDLDCSVSAWLLVVLRRHPLQLLQPLRLPTSQSLAPQARLLYPLRLPLRSFHPPQLQLQRCSRRFCPLPPNLLMRQAPRQLRLFNPHPCLCQPTRQRQQWCQRFRPRLSQLCQLVLLISLRCSHLLAHHTNLSGRLSRHLRSSPRAVIRIAPNKSPSR